MGINKWNATYSSFRKKLNLFLFEGNITFKVNNKVKVVQHKDYAAITLFGSV